MRLARGFHLRSEADIIFVSKYDIRTGLSRGCLEGMVARWSNMHPEPSLLVHPRKKEKRGRETALKPMVNRDVSAELGTGRRINCPRISRVGLCASVGGDDGFTAWWQVTFQLDERYSSRHVFFDTVGTKRTSCHIDTATGVTF